MNESNSTETNKPVNGFTPPPWLARKGSFQEPERWIVVSGGKVAYVIATIENGAPGDTLETEGHTAHLVAAAPDLYAALKIACSEMRNARHALQSGSGINCEGDSFIWAAILAGESALKKAAISAE